MPNISPEILTRKNGTVGALRRDRLPWWEHWRELSNYYLPRRYIWLLSPNERQRIKSKSPFILDATGTSAARTQSAGMMNGITSPARPWFRLNIPGMDDERNRDVRLWLDEVTVRLLVIMAQSNFYNGMATMYLDLSIFGTSSMLIYEDFESVFRCYNPALGEYYLAQSDRLAVNTFMREISVKVHQVVEWFGLENCSQAVQDHYKAGGARLQTDVDLNHLIEPNTPEDRMIARRFPYREIYWERGTNTGRVLSVNGYNDLPGIFPRWELVANDSYGSSPAMDALPDVIQLQHETKKKAEGIDFMIRPPVIADIQLQHKPNALLPRGVTFVGPNSFGAKPVFTVQPPIAEMAADIIDIRNRIREIFSNDLFKMIANLETVRSATEIDARREEKLVLLGPVLERFENEALDPAIKRIFNIAQRAGLIPDPPAEIEGDEIDIQYVSILSVAQRAVSAAPVERWVQLIGLVGGIAPSTINVPDWDELVRDYGRDVGVKEKLIRSSDDSNSDTQAQRQAEQLRQTLETGKIGAEGLKNLSQSFQPGPSGIQQSLP